MATWGVPATSALKRFYRGYNERISMNVTNKQIIVSLTISIYSTCIKECVSFNNQVGQSNVH